MDVQLVVLGDVRLEKVCDRCNGTRKQSEHLGCRECGGRGKVPTEAGKTLLHFVAGNLRTVSGGDSLMAWTQDNVFVPG